MLRVSVKCHAGLRRVNKFLTCKFIRIWEYGLVKAYLAITGNYSKLCFDTPRESIFERCAIRALSNLSARVAKSSI